VWIELGTVDPDEMAQDFSSNLTGPGGTGERANLTWYGGTYLDATGLNDVSGYLIYQSPSPGSAVSYGTPVSNMPAYPARIITDGFGIGEFGRGGFGRSASSYEWYSDPLTSGVWQFAVVPYDNAGNAQTSAQTISVTISTAPRPPEANDTGTRLTYSYPGSASPVATLNWLASPH
jgi:hypothetical protein